MRVGIGYDVHPLIAGHMLVLGGVDIPYDRGLAGWSDADVLAHAIIDSLLGATALGDIGTHFPSSDLKYKGVSSMHLLKLVSKLLYKDNWSIINIDSVILAEQPRLLPYFKSMQQEISKALGINTEQVSIKATTTEGMGFTGRGEGIAAHAVALVEKI
ncbi:MAG: 2-C-methyl-D-erythritol 2,4-cyclodiphosphate synthase [Chloroflexi bacterium]|nr:2-C-methyl-D-erythritol 2,4-cyclodiphosphate synthase [Chloroflexota bacterium]